MSDREIKVGDRVCFKDGHHIHIVLDINDKGQYKVSGVCGYWGACYLVPAENVNRRIVFLRKLSNLLCEFDAEIEPEFSVCSGLASVNLKVGGEYVVESVDPINADNIMDFEKE